MRILAFGYVDARVAVENSITLFLLDRNDYRSKARFCMVEHHGLLPLSEGNNFEDGVLLPLYLLHAKDALRFSKPLAA